MQRACAFLTALVLCFVLSASSAKAADAGPSRSLEAMILLAADRIDAAFGYVAQSAKSLGREYAVLKKSLPPATEAEKERWSRAYSQKDGTVAFTTWQGENPPKSQSPLPAFLFYNGTAFTDETFHNLKIFEELSSAFRAEYETFGFSWVYLTTVDESFMIYPFLPLEEGVNNYQPTKKLFYTIADFKNRTFGWESPYLDLAGAGMMITVSWPIYDGDRLLGVSSRDVTLKQLSNEILSRVAVLPGATACIVNTRGKVIGVSDQKLAAELDAKNTEAGDAVLHYRDKAGLAKLSNPKAVNSSSAFMNAACENILAEAKKGGFSSSVVRTREDGRIVLAAKTALTGWYVVLAMPE